MFFEQEGKFVYLQPMERFLSRQDSENCDRDDEQAAERERRRGADDRRVLRREVHLHLVDVLAGVVDKVELCMCDDEMTLDRTRLKRNLGIAFTFMSFEVALAVKRVYVHVSIERMNC